MFTSKGGERTTGFVPYARVIVQSRLQICRGHFLGNGKAVRVLVVCFLGIIAGNPTQTMLATHQRQQKVTSRRSDSGKRLSAGLHMVAMTFHPCDRKYFAVSRPKPDELPVINTVLTSTTPPSANERYSVPVQTAPGIYVVGEEDYSLNSHLLVGHCEFRAPDSRILVALLPKVVHIRKATRLTTLVELVIEESREQRPGREPVLARLLEVLLIEAFRTKMDTPSVPGLLVGLADERLAAAIRRIHEDVSQSWTVAQLAQESALSRSAFFQRFSDSVGYTPMEYVTVWRMTIAKDLLRRRPFAMAEIAERVGYKSASAFSSAFKKYTGQSPSKFAGHATEAPLFD